MPYAETSLKAKGRSSREISLLPWSAAVMAGGRTIGWMPTLACCYKSGLQQRSSPFLSYMEPSLTNQINDRIVDLHYEKKALGSLPVSKIEQPPGTSGSGSLSESVSRAHQHDSDSDPDTDAEHFHPSPGAPQAHEKLLRDALTCSAGGCRPQH
jgi:hypothetical protein